jgi:hypothetical protein
MSKPADDQKSTWVMNCLHVSEWLSSGAVSTRISRSLVITGMTRFQQVSSTRLRRLVFIIYFIPYREVVIFCIFPPDVTTTLTKRGMDFPVGEFTVPRNVTKYKDGEDPLMDDGLFA